MIVLNEKNIFLENRQSSKGNQLKGCVDGSWYKADYLGYEGLAEYMVSGLLKKTSLESNEFIDYKTEKIQYKNTEFTGCISANFLKKGWQLITLERLFRSYYGESLNRSLYRLPEARDRLQFLVEQTVRITGLEEFGKYMGKVLAVDTFFLNEDRHTHNLAVLLDEYGKYHYCPMFDHGGALLSDTTLDYPMTGDVYALIKNAKPKTFCGNFDEQLDIAEELYGQQIQFMFDDKEADRLLNEEAGYPQDIKERVSTILRWQKHRYQYLFQK